MKILIVEDDYLQADWLKETLGDYFPGSTVQQISTESEFRSQIEHLRKSPPDLVLLDVMLRWADPSPKTAVPTEDAKNGFFRAGLRCEGLLRQFKETRRTPVILYTVLQGSDLGEELHKFSPAVPTYYVGKASDSSQLIETITRLARHFS